jgi:hypothetical protein
LIKIGYRMYPTKRFDGSVIYAEHERCTKADDAFSEKKSGDGIGLLTDYAFQKNMAEYDLTIESQSSYYFRMAG